MNLANSGSIWYTAAIAEYASPADWKAWADARIAREKIPDQWLIDMSLAGNVTELGDALLKCRSNSLLVDDRLALGFVRLRNERGDFRSLVDFVDALFEVADETGDPSVEPEFFAGLRKAIVSKSKREDAVLNELYEATDGDLERAREAWESLYDERV
jgi:hypothetical protein